MNNIDFAALLDDIAQLLALTDTNPFRVKAYENASRLVRGMEEPIAPLVAGGTVTSLKGIGKGIAADLEQMLATGSCDSLDALRAAIPPGYADLTRVRGLGPKRIQTLRAELGIENLDSLEEAAASGRLATVAGMTDKTVAKMTDEIRRIRAAGSGVVVGSAFRAGQALRDWAAEQLEPGDEVTLAGSVARGDELHAEVVVVVRATTAEAAIARLLAAAPEATAQEGTVTLEPRAGLGRRIVVAGLERAAAQWLLETATPAVLAALQARAVARGLGDLRALRATSTAALFALLDLPNLPPELLSDLRGLDASADDIEALVSLDKMRRDLHLHTTWSDGGNTILEMATAAGARGYDAIAVTDHSPSLTVARGLSAERLTAQITELRAADAPVRLFAGLEVDILADGQLDMEPALLDELDWVVGSVHGQMSQQPAVMTDRLLRAISSGRIDALGHPTGRILGGRPGFDFDIDAIFDACETHGVALELNAAPERLDLNDTLLRRALARPGIRFVINTDAHSVAELSQMHHGVRMARRAGVPASRVLNCLDAEAFARHLETRRPQ
jgi:DNA polymerase (family 10)